MKVTVYITAKHYYKKTVEVDCIDEAQDKVLAMYDNGELDDYEDELISIKIAGDEPNNGE